MKLRDRLWLWQNKKPQRPFLSYLQIALLWTIYGVLLGWGTVMVMAIPRYWYIGVGLVIFCLVMLFWFYWWDRRNGYVAVIHQQWLTRWLARKKRIEDEK